MYLEQFASLSKIVLIIGIVLMVSGVFAVSQDWRLDDFPVAGLIVLVGFVLVAFSRWTR